MAAEPATPASPPVAEETPATEDAGDPAIPATRGSLPNYDRDGLTLTGGAGVWSCGADECALFPIAGLGRLEFGYRRSRVAVLGRFSYGGAKISTPTEEGDGFTIAGFQGDARRLEAGVGFQFFPVSAGRWDPFVGFGLGYAGHKTTVSPRDDSSTLEFSYKTGALSIEGGIPVHVRRHVSLGPRVTWTMPFAGDTCIRTTGAPEGEVDIDDCVPVVDTTEGFDAYNKRLARRQFIRPWSVTFDVRVVF